MKRPISNSVKFSSFRNLWVRHKLTRVKGRKFRVLIYARYSTDEQNPRSIEDQVLYCRQFLESLGVKTGDYELTVLSDEGISGEKIRRPGIDEVWDGIRQRSWDLILPEDAARLYRDAAVCIDLVRAAVDKKMRVICINDEVDTADEENWEERLYEAARHHQKSNKYTSRRIKRSQEGLFALGAAMHQLKPGYLRRPQNPAKPGEPQEGPYFDFVDESKRDIIVQAYEYIAAGESPLLVAKWLTAIGFDKAANAQRPDWTDRNVVELIRRPDYRGIQRFRDTISVKNYRTGGYRGEKSPEDRKMMRKMPHLRIVPDWLWYAANKAIDDRRPAQESASGVDHVLFGVPRNARGALSVLFRCGARECGAVMHKSARQNGYRCGRATDGCWNKASCLAALTDKPIYAAVVRSLRSLDPEIDRLLALVATLIGDAASRDTRKAELRELIAELQAKIVALNDALEKAPDLESTRQRLGERELDLAEATGELEGLLQDDLNKRPPTRREIESRIAELLKLLATADRHSREALSSLVDAIDAIPHRQFGGDKVVLRARFEIRLAALLPARTRAALVGLHGKLDDLGFERIAVMVDLFEPSTGPKYGLEALALYDQKIGLTEIGVRLGISKRQANIAVQYGRLLREAGLTDPFIELTAPPPQASRWRAPGTGKRRSKKEPPQDPRQAG
ncbi:MAG: recombinase family protein [Planctomycetes bacterium]|nr:recombinase family protein [Planctomycetota bacterium]